MNYVTSSIVRGKVYLYVEDHDGIIQKIIHGDKEDASDGAVINALIYS